LMARTMAAARRIMEVSSIQEQHLT
jgi:hypothetical protein